MGSDRPGRGVAAGWLDCLFDNRNYVMVHYCQLACLNGFEWCMLGLGPCLILTVMGLATTETYWALVYLLPLGGVEPGTARYAAHCVWVAFLLVNCMFNYFSCVFTNPGKPGSDVYRELVYDARETGVVSSLDWDDYARIYGGDAKEGALLQRTRLADRARFQGSNRDVRMSKLSTASWVDRGPYEWGYCKRSYAPKAPRSHYDHVTKSLVLNMDHYCPWMFNVVGFANYRYFILFLLWICVACLYGIGITLVPFLKLVVRKDRAFRLGSEARTAVSFTFVLALSIGIAVAVLFIWHVYLVMTAQTTIEFYGNYTLSVRAKARGRRFRNPYDRGGVLNWQLVFGPGHPLLAILPSRRPPPAAPWPEPAKAYSQLEVV